jgi:hypothetical protein
MPVKENQFNLNMLWPPSRHHWHAPGAVQSVAAEFGPGLDIGALRIGEHGYWEMLLRPTWVLFEPDNPVHYELASGFRRYGAGWSYGPGHNQHSEVVTYFIEVYGVAPTKMEQYDIEHNETLYRSLLKVYHAKIGFDPDGPVDPPPPPPPPPPLPPQPPTPPVPVPGPVVGLPPLSAPEQRAAELMSLLPPFLRRSWMTPLVVEAVKAGRRAQERIVARILAGKP